MRIVDIKGISETYNKAYIEREDSGIKILMSQDLEVNEEEYLQGTIDETQVSLPSTSDLELYELDFSGKMKREVEKWANTFPADADDYDFEKYQSYLPENKEQFKELTDVQLFDITVNFLAEIASIDWEVIDFDSFFSYVN